MGCTDENPGESTWHEQTKAVQKWADTAMYEAQPIDAKAGPQVQLLSANNDPLGSIAAAAKAYVGEFVSSLAEITDDERRHYLGEMQKTKLAMPLESVHFQFHISGVTRGFTHQMVRQRTAAYSQESTRFAVKTGVPVGYPPSIADAMPWEEWVKKCAFELFPRLTEHAYRLTMTPMDRGRVADYAVEHATPQLLWRREWDAFIEPMGNTYRKLVDMGMPAEDARGILPTNLLTQINYHTNLRNFIDEGGKRLCTQAQFEWRIVFSRMLEAIRRYPVENHVRYDDSRFDSRSDWQFEAIADLFRPSCYLEGSCPFNADFDRKCSIRPRVEQNARIGRASSEWGKELPTYAEVDYWSGAERTTQQGIPAINPAEWLLDPTAAR